MTPMDVLADGAAFLAPVLTDPFLCAYRRRQSAVA
jgi:hypothetical protein